MGDKTPHDVYLSDISERDKPWDSHRSSTSVVQKLYNGIGYERYAERLEQCSRLLGFQLAQIEDSSEQRLKLAVASFCRVRLCPVCQWRRRKLWLARFLSAVPKLLEDYPKARYLFLTLTVKNCQVTDLRATLQQMNKAWERLSKRKSFPAIGWIKSVEVTRNPNTSEAHPHFHVLMVVNPGYFKTPNYLKQSEWRALWRAALRADYDPVVNIKTVKARSKSTQSSDSVAQDVAAGLLETLKYGVKESDLVSDQDWLKEITNQLHKTRAVAIGGILRDYLREEEPEDLITEDPDAPSESDASIFFGWREQVQRYGKIDPS